MKHILIQFRKSIIDYQVLIIINNQLNINKAQQINNNQDIYDLSININIDMLNNLDKNDRIDIISFIRYACKIKTLSKFIHLGHNIFRISHSNNNKECSLILKNKIFLSNHFIQNQKIDNN